MTILWGKTVRENLPLCGKCVNCKLQVWDDPENAKEYRSINVMWVDGKNIYFVLNCNWLRHSVFDPQKLVLCEGRRSVDGQEAEG
jgi:hypothetical protein